MMWRITYARSALEGIGHVAAVQFSRAAESVRPRGFLGGGLSKLNSMHRLELHEMWHHAKAWWELAYTSSGWPGQVRSTY